MARRQIERPPRLPGVYRIINSEDDKTHVVVADADDPRRKGGRLRKEMVIQAASDAEAFVQLQAAITRLRLTGHGAPAETTTLGELTKSFLALYAPTVDPGTVERMGYEAKLALVHVGDFWTLKLVAQDIQACVNSLIAEGYARSTVHGCLRTIVLIVRRNLRYFTRDLQDDLLVARAVKVPGEDRSEDDGDDYTPPVELLRKFLEHARARFPEFSLFMDWKVTWGIRGTHLVALKVQDVDRDEMVARMRRKVYRGRVGKVTERKPVPRTLPLDEGMLADFDAHLRRLVGRRVNPEGWVFPGSTGKPMHLDGLRDAWAACCVAVGIDADRWKPHGARGSFYDVLRGKVADKAAQGITAHTPRMQRHYETVDASERRNVVTIMRGVLRGKEGA